MREEKVWNVKTWWINTRSGITSVEFEKEVERKKNEGNERQRKWNEVRLLIERGKKVEVS